MLKEIIANRRILYSMIRRDLRARYVGSALGLFWSIINPMIMLGIYIVLFSAIIESKIGANGKPISYPVYLCCALFPWNTISESIMRSSNIILENSALIKKVQFPHAILPLMANLSSFINLLIAYTLFLIFLVASQGLHTLLFILFLPLVFMLQLLFTLGASYFFATVNVFIRDTSQILGAVFIFLFWGTPIVYFSDLFTGHEGLPGRIAEYWFMINPLVHMLNIYRDILQFNQMPSIYSILYLIILSTLGLLIGCSVFQKYRRKFVDEV